MNISPLIDNIFLIRHDQVVFPPHHEQAGRPSQGIILGQLDYPITTTWNATRQGRYDHLARTIAMGETNGREGRDIFFAGSDLGRVNQTFDILIRHIKQHQPNLLPPNLHVDKNLREQHFGQWQGLTYNHIEQHDKQQYDIFWQDYINQAPPPNHDGEGESFFNLYQRSTKAMMAWLSPAQAAKKTMVFIAHDGVLRALLAFFYSQGKGEALPSNLHDGFAKAMTCQLPYLAMIKLQKNTDYENWLKPVIEIM